LMAVLLFAFRLELAGLFIDAGKPNGAEVVALAATLLIYAAVFQMADGAQAIFMGSLRGMSDAKVPMLLAAVSYWVVGFSLAYILGLFVGLGAPGIWMGLAVGLFVAALLLGARFRRQSRRGYLPAVTAGAPAKA